MGSRKRNALAEVVELSSDSEDESSGTEEESPELSGSTPLEPQLDPTSEAAICALVEGGAPIKTLRLVDDLKPYLKCKGLRIAGSKDEVVGRILDYLQLRQLDVRSLFPQQSFSVDCTGDVCLADKVLFQHCVYPENCHDFDIKGSLIPPVGRRTVAARVVCESYGELQQQHTFTLEVLWTDGPKPLTLMAQLQIKGRNLYRYRTRRQPWASEEERKLVLHEKHVRGAAARALKRGRPMGKKPLGLKSRSCSIRPPRPGTGAPRPAVTARVSEEPTSDAPAQVHHIQGATGRQPTSNPVAGRTKPRPIHHSVAAPGEPKRGGAPDPPVAAAVSNVSQAAVSQEESSRGMRDWALDQPEECSRSGAPAASKVGQAAMSKKERKRIRALNGPQKCFESECPNYCSAKCVARMCRSCCRDKRCITHSKKRRYRNQAAKGLQVDPCMSREL